MSSEQPQNNPTAETAQPRRRSSGFMPAFNSLQEHRHHGPTAARRQSMSDQSKAGFFSNFFHSTWGKNAK